VKRVHVVCSICKRIIGLSSVTHNVYVKSLACSGYQPSALTTNLCLSASSLFCLDVAELAKQVLSAKAILELVRKQMRAYPLDPKEQVGMPLQSFMLARQHQSCIIAGTS
jgi:hypothetical protein